MIETNHNKCVKCYKCISICPFTVLGKDNDGFPLPLEGKACIKCMHCAAICPKEALTFDGKKAVSNKTVTYIPGGFSDELKNFLLQRRSYRHFKDIPVDEQIIQDVLNTARWMPSAKNQHPTKFIVINSKDILNKMMNLIVEYVRRTGIAIEVADEFEAGNNIVMGNANTILIAYARDNAINPGGDTYIKMAGVELLFQSKGIGTCWCGYLTRFLNTVPGLNELLPEIPEGNSFYSSFMLGYPVVEEKYNKIPERLKEADIKWV